ncbi:arginine-glutamic acid dipeptide repeats protein isoform X1 [Dendroctonus ponderosae]|uniref:arginine-glutamic acid dipeptide repeats protein isoform X1 n=1 Tax=Dendroctonus ponderosae TaxID=77166 RepID=UPI00203522C5|nr:arginine-glutamic acid dipeptide repeats protein isoform X1 [Dendroctonus ponderosae]XP_019759686.2 arginine-glutamic acid dipeptide repeats protein isoform X1 [Dendroctonus ponderosae]
MVCKEDILTWFQDLESYKRIDMLCELINMCLPFELRFVGSFLEETGKHSYQALRQRALAANDYEKLEKDTSLKDRTLYEENIRHLMLINVSLLKSRNYNVANWYSKNFLRTDYIEELVVKEKNEIVQNELLLLYTMATRHPAFSFDQKQFYNRILVRLYELRDSRSNKSCTYRYPPGFEYPSFYRNNKVYENTQVPVAIPMHPPGLPHQLDNIGNLRVGWHGLTCGAPAEVPPFSSQHPLQPPQPTASPLVNSPSQSRCGSPRPLTRAPPFPMVASTTQIVSIPSGNHPSVGTPSGLPSTITSQLPSVIPVASVLPGMPISIESLGPPPPMGHSDHPSPVYGMVKSSNQLHETEELNPVLIEDSLQKHPPPLSLNPWMTNANINSEGKQINGLRIASNYPTSTNMRSSIADQLHSMSLTDESSHYHSSSSSSPLQTPPDTPSNIAPASTTSTQSNRGPIDKCRMNGVPNFLTPFGDTTSPPPPHGFTYPAYAPIAHASDLPYRFYASPNFRPPTTVFNQFQTATNQPFQGAQPTGSETIPPSYSYTIPYISLMYSSYPHPPQVPQPPTNTIPLRNQPPGCYNCGATGHLGQDCPERNIDDITQKNTYSIDFSPVNSDNEK